MPVLPQVQQGAELVVNLNVDGQRMARVIIDRMEQLVSGPMRAAPRHYVNCLAALPDGLSIA